MTELGGHLALVLIMKQWMNHPTILAECCYVLGAVGMDNEFAKAVVDLGVIGLLINIMRTYPHDEYIQLYGCGAILVLSLDEEVYAMELVNKWEGIPVIILALQHFPKSCDIEDLSCQIFLSLSEYPLLKKTLVKCGAIRAIGTVLERYVKEAGNSNKSTTTTVATTTTRQQQQQPTSSNVSTIADSVLSNDDQTVEVMAKETLRRLLNL